MLLISNFQAELREWKNVFFSVLCCVQPIHSRRPTKRWKRLVHTHTAIHTLVTTLTHIHGACHPIFECRDVRKMWRKWKKIDKINCGVCAHTDAHTKQEASADRGRVNERERDGRTETEVKNRCNDDKIPNAKNTDKKHSKRNEMKNLRTHRKGGAFSFFLFSHFCHHPTNGFVCVCAQWKMTAIKHVHVSFGFRTYTATQTNKVFFPFTSCFFVRLPPFSSAALSLNYCRMALCVLLLQILFSVRESQNMRIEHMHTRRDIQHYFERVKLAAAVAAWHLNVCTQSTQMCIYVFRQ